LKKLTKILRPSYTTGFKCIGSSCQDSCCIGWSIDIDKITYRKYFRTTNLEMKKEFSKKVVRNEHCLYEDIDYGNMKLSKNKWCPFLEEDKLCRIYKVLGEDYLSNVCYSYPRVYNIIDGVYELSMYMSCPEVVRKLLSDKKPIEFIGETILLDRHLTQSIYNSKESRATKSPLIHLKNLRRNSIEIVQNRKLSIEDRLLKLGQNLSDNKDYSPVDVDNKYLFRVGFFNGLIKSLKVFKEIDSEVFISLTRDLINGLKLGSDSLIESSKIYKDIEKKIVTPYINKNNHLFENYLVNFMFQGNFPFNVNDNKFDGYLMMVVRYSFIRFYLLGIAVKNGKITLDDVVLMVQVHTKTISHHDIFLTNLLDELKEKEFDNMAFVSNLFI